MIKKYAEEWKIFGIALGFRLAVYLLSVCIMALFGDYPEGIAFSDFLRAWQRWDSGHYLNLAENGYMGAVENGEHIFLVFFPLYPWLIRILSLFIPSLPLCGILISAFCFAGGSVFFYKLVKLEYGAKTAKNAMLLISLFPFAFFFGAVLTESLFFFLASGFLYFLRRHKWGLVAVFGFFACMTKVQGLLLAFSVLAELFYFKRGFTLLRKRDWHSFFKRIIFPGCIAALMLFGFAVYLAINYAVEGDPLRFLYYQEKHWSNGRSFVWATVGYIAKYAFGEWHTPIGMGMWVPELLLFAGYLAAIAYGIRRRMRPTYLVYLVAFFLLTYSSSWLLSAGRYTLAALPVFMLLGELVYRKPRLKTGVIVTSAMLMAVYMTGYFMGKPIM